MGAIDYFVLIQAIRQYDNFTIPLNIIYTTAAVWIRLKAIAPLLARPLSRLKILVIQLRLLFSQFLIPTANFTNDCHFRIILN